MKTILISFFLLSSFSILATSPKNLDELLQKVKEERINDRKNLSEREQRFVRERNRQRQLLAEETKKLKALEKISTQLQSNFEKNEKELGALEEKLNIAIGTLGEMFGVVKQTAGDFKGQFQNSIISAQFPRRDEFMGNIAERKKLPNLEDLNRLWFEIQKEMTESGKIVRFQAPVVTTGGQKENKTIVRIGSFNLVSDGKYLLYQSNTNQVIELPRQPQGKFLGMIDDLEELKKGHAPFGLDPSRGAILGMLVQAPSLKERLQQGGLVGYVILTLLLLGLILTGERIKTLHAEKKKMKEQLKDTSKISLDNPIGQLMSVFKRYQKDDIETLEMKLDETILKSTPKLERGISTIKILSAVAPLLGLLGTVTGMIATFQSITLFGTGDPKLMAGGISTALITTVLGLVCAIPLLLFHNFVSAQSKQLIQILEEQSAGLLSQKMEQETT